VTPSLRSTFRKSLFSRWLRKLGDNYLDARRLARAIESRGAGLGEILIGCAVDRCLHARSLVGAYALLVDAKDEWAKSFYERYGFIPCLDAPMTLYLPLG